MGWPTTSFLVSTVPSLSGKGGHGVTKEVAEGTSKWTRPHCCGIGAPASAHSPNPLPAWREKDSKSIPNILSLHKFVYVHSGVNVVVQVGKPKFGGPEDAGSGTNKAASQPVNINTLKVVLERVFGLCSMVVYRCAKSYCSVSPC